MSIWTQYREPKFVPECKDNSFTRSTVALLKIKVDLQIIKDSWACKFVNEMYARAKQNYPFTNKQKAKIEELFERLK